MNKVILIGRLARDPEMRTTGSGIAVTRFTVAVSRPFNPQNGQPQTDFINCVAWRRQAENIAKYCNKGSQVAVEGRIQTGSYDAQDGSKRYTTEVVADSVQFLETKGQREAYNNNSAPESNMSPYDYQTPSSNNSNDFTNNVNVEDDPFADFGDTVSIDDNFLD